MPSFLNTTGVASILLILAATAASAEKRTTPLPLAKSESQAAAAAAAAADTQHPATLIATFVSAGGESTQTFASGFHALDTPKSVTCPSTALFCRIEAQQFFQVGDNGNATPNNNYGVASLVDGNYMLQPYPPLAGYVPTDGHFVTSAFAQNMSRVQPGVHTVSTQIYSSNGVVSGVYEISYRVYTYR